MKNPIIIKTQKNQRKINFWRFWTFENIQKMVFLAVLDLGTSLEFNFMQFRIEPTSRRSISRDFEIFENSSEN